jgi:hypothetical protein
LFGVSTYYRREHDGSLTIKLEGQLNDVPLFEQLSILREVDLWHHWAPFCTDSRNLAQLGNVDMIGWLVTGSPIFGLSRDLCFRVIGCDSLREQGKIILVAEGIGNESSENKDHGSFLASDPLIQRIDIPPIPTRLGSGRMTLRKFEAIVDVLSPTSAQTRIISNIDPNISFIPHSLLDFVMRKMCGVLLHHLQQAAHKLSLRPDKTPYAERIRSDPFYESWLLPKFRQFCLYKGWKFPSIQVLNLPNLYAVDNSIVLATEACSQVAVCGDSSEGFDEKQSTLNSPLWNQNPGNKTYWNPLIKRQMRKELERAQSRELILNSLRPTPFKEDQLSRLKLLRLLKEKVSGSSSSELNGDRSKIHGTVWHLLFHPRPIEDILTGVIPYFSHKRMVGGLLSIEFLLFYAVSDENRVLFDVSTLSKDRLLVRWSARLLQIVIFCLVYFILMNRTLVAMFDTLKLPGASKISNDKALAASRKLFVHAARIGCIYSLVFFLVVSFMHGALRSVEIADMENARMKQSRFTWDEIAIDDAKWFISYSSVFMISILFITNSINPGQKLN